MHDTSDRFRSCSAAAAAAVAVAVAAGGGGVGSRVYGTHIICTQGIFFAAPVEFCFFEMSQQR